MVRDNRIDSIKGFLIILVILGHLIGSCGSGIMNDKAWLFIYTFHMPLFILISGYFSKKRVSSSDFFKSLLPIVKPLVVFQVINVFLHCIIFRDSLRLSYLLVPYWTLWYLLSLIFWRIMTQYSPKCLHNRPLFYLCGATVVALFFGLLPHGRVLSIQRTFYFYPFFLLGFYMRQGLIKTKIWPNSISYLIIITVVLLIAFDLYPTNSNILLKGADQYSIKDIPNKVFLLMCSFATSVSFFNLLGNIKYLDLIGKNSLFWYCYHGIIIRFFVAPIINHFHLPNSFLFMLLYLIMIVFALYMMNKIKCLRWLIAPSVNKEPMKSAV